MCWCISQSHMLCEWQKCAGVSVKATCYVSGTNVLVYQSKPHVVRVAQMYWCVNESHMLCEWHK